MYRKLFIPLLLCTCNFSLFAVSSNHLAQSQAQVDDDDQDVDDDYDDEYPDEDVFLLEEDVDEEPQN
ncbi:MAG TPA: hypothetical protein VGJ00_00225 [Rhabdochlamydiaceae bacterium]